MPFSDTSLASGSDRVDTSFRSTIIHSLECMADYFIRAWECVKDGFLAGLDWISDRVCCYAEDDTDDHKKEFVQNAKTQAKQVSPNRPITKNISDASSPLSRPPTISGRPIRTNSPPSLQANQSQSQVSISSQNNRTASTSSLETKTIQEGRSPEPPKIDFIETGSIFGDRKRPALDMNMLQLENGRFRSPGQPRTIPGPGGRMIRVSFVSGFPQYKSVDSSKSVQTTMSKQTSVRSTDTNDFTQRGRLSITKSYKSNKSNKSVGSIGSGETKG